MHIESDVREFRDDMKKFIQGFMNAEGSSSQPAPRKWKMCELLLVGFMRNTVAPSFHSEIAENLVVWNEKCNDPDENLIDSFHEMMVILKPPVFEEKDIGYKFEDGKKMNQTSVFVVDWMVRKFLPPAKIPEWDKKVVLTWFDASNFESAAKVLERAEIFLQKQFKNERWGLKILGKVIETNSYVVFFRVDALAMLLLREYCQLQVIRDTHHRMQEDFSEPEMAQKPRCALLIPVGLIVSSSEWNWSFSEGEKPSSAHISEIAWHLRRIASIPPGLLEDSECSMGKLAFVEPIYNLKVRFLTGSQEELVMAPTISAHGAAAVKKLDARHSDNDSMLQALFKREIGVVKSYIEDFKECVGYYEDTASGERLPIDQMSISVQTSLSGHVASTQRQTRHTTSKKQKEEMMGEEERRQGRKRQRMTKRMRRGSVFVCVEMHICVHAKRSRRSERRKRM